MTHWTVTSRGERHPVNLGQIHAHPAVVRVRLLDYDTESEVPNMSAILIDFSPVTERRSFNHVGHSRSLDLRFERGWRGIGRAHRRASKGRPHLRHGHPKARRLHHLFWRFFDRV